MTIIVTVWRPDPEERQAWATHLGQALGNDYQVVTQVDPLARHAAVWAAPEDFFARSPRLQSVFSMGAGVDHLLHHPGLPPALPIYRLEDAGMGEQMARYCRHEVEHVLLHHQRYATQKQQKQWHELPARSPADLTVGIIGFGVLGRRVAAALTAEGYPVRAFVRTAGQRENEGVSLFAGPQQWPAFLAGTQVLILLAPHTAQTHHLVDAQALAMLPGGAWLVNVARGGLIDDEAVQAALRSGHLAGATLDVFSTEPLPVDSAWWTLPQVRITPHVSAVTLVPESALQIARRIHALDAGQDAGATVDRRREY
ncbi:MAG: NAD(P)-dependent oxidoreductase [Burkholderiaceae bacterium]